MASRLVRRGLNPQIQGLWKKWSHSNLRATTSVSGMNETSISHPRRSFSSYEHTPLFQSNIHEHVEEYTQLADSSVVETQIIDGEEYLRVKPEAMKILSEQAFGDIAHLLRPAHLRQLSSILDDPEASENDKFVAMELLKNANIASARILPGCQGKHKHKHLRSTTSHTTVSRY